MANAIRQWRLIGALISRREKLPEQAFNIVNNRGPGIFWGFFLSLDVVIKIPATLASIEEQYLIFITLYNRGDRGVLGDILSDVVRVMHDE